MADVTSCKDGLWSLLIDLFSSYVLFPNSDHVMFSFCLFVTFLICKHMHVDART